jgi:hypothetical protein
MQPFEDQEGENRFFPPIGTFPRQEEKGACFVCKQRGRASEERPKKKVLFVVVDGEKSTMNTFR